MLTLTEELPDANAIKLPKAKRQMAWRWFGYSRLVNRTTEIEQHKKLKIVKSEMFGYQPSQVINIQDVLIHHGINNILYGIGK